MNERLSDPLEATLQRFISRDPIGLKGGSNGYSYCKNRPVDFVDPSGLIHITDALRNACPQIDFDKLLNDLRNKLTTDSACSNLPIADYLYFLSPDSLVELSFDPTNTSEHASTLHFITKTGAIGGVTEFTTKGLGSCNPSVIQAVIMHELTHLVVFKARVNLADTVRKKFDPIRGEAGADALLTQLTTQQNLQYSHPSNYFDPLIPAGFGTVGFYTDQKGGTHRDGPIHPRSFPILEDEIKF